MSYANFMGAKPLFMLIAAASIAACGSPETVTQTSTVTVTSTLPASAAEQQRIDQERSALDQRQRELDARESAIATAEAVAASNTFTGDGTFLVGQEIQPGTWRSQGGSGCYWKRLDSLDGSSQNIIDNENARGPTIVTIAPTDVAFHTDDCGTWTRIGS